MSSPEFITAPNGNRLAYHHSMPSKPQSAYGVIFLPGFMSDMEGTKAVYLEAFCQNEGIEYTRFDYQGHGVSDGEFTDGTIGSWADDAVQIIDEVTQLPQILIGSSMGGWIMLLAALKRPEKVHALLGIAAAPDFTEDLMWEEMTEEQQRQVMEEGITHIPTIYEGEESSFPITKALIEDGRKNLLLRDTINLDMPVRLIHGLKDEDVPVNVAGQLVHQLKSEDVQLTTVKNGEHRLSEPEELALLKRTVLGLAKPENQ